MPSAPAGEPSVVLSTCDIPEWRAVVNYEMPAGCNVQVLNSATATLLGSGVTERSDREEEYVRWKLAKPEGSELKTLPSAQKVLYVSNEGGMAASLVVTIPNMCDAVDAHGGVYPKTWFTCDGDDHREPIYTFVIHVAPGEWLRPFGLTNAEVTKKDIAWGVIPNVPHPTPYPTAPVKLIGMPIGGEGFEPPTGGWRCGQGFEGGLTHFGLYNCHSVDFECEEGTPVVAAADGVVTTVTQKHDRSGGHIAHLYSGYNQVVVAHADGTEACYLHLLKDSVMVEEGQAVRRGQHLASTGSSGFAPWPHIHFQMNRSSATGKDEDLGESVPFAFESTDPARRAFVAVAGYNYTAAGRVGPVSGT